MTVQRPCARSTLASCTILSKADRGNRTKQCEKERKERKEKSDREKSNLLVNRCFFFFFLFYKQTVTKNLDNEHHLLSPFFFKDVILVIKAGANKNQSALLWEE